MNFNTDRDQLISRYRLGTEKALEQADFINNPDITVLQALSIYLYVLQHIGESQPAWFLAGVLIRVAVSLKLHRDGLHLAKTTPFEIEMRRRLWWHICLVDSQSYEVHFSEFKISEEMFDTKTPTNVDDASLDPVMQKSPVSEQRWTDMTTFIIRCEVWKLSRRLRSLMTTNKDIAYNINTGVELFEKSRARIEESYLKHLDPNQPLHCFVATMARLFLTKIDLIHTKRFQARTEESQPTQFLQSEKVFKSSITIIEDTYALQNEPSWSGWVWQIEGRQPPWHALFAVLHQLRTRPWGPTCERAWPSVMKSFKGFSEVERRDPRYEQLVILISAVQKRVDELLHQNSGRAANSQVEMPSAAASNLSASLAQVGISETYSTWTAQELSNESAFLEMPSLEMDWQGWDDLANQPELNLELWDMGGF